MYRLFLKIADHLSNIGRGFAGIPFVINRSVFDVNFPACEDSKIEGFREDRKNLRRDCNLAATDFSSSLELYKKEKSS